MFNRFIISSIMAFLLLASANLSADVLHETSTIMDFKGTLGTVMKAFGAEKPIHNIVYLKGNVMRTDHLGKKDKLESSEIIDLDKDLIISINHKKKKYTQMTFAEYRAKIEEAMQGLKDMETDNSESSDASNDGPKMKFSLDVQTPGDIETINGYKAEKMIIEMKAEPEEQPAVEDEGEEQPAGGEMMVTTTLWLCDELAGQKEIDAFNQKYIQKLGLDPELANMKNMLSQLMTSNPQLAEAMEKMGTASKDVKGVPISTHMVYTSTAPPRPEGEQEEEAPRSLGGLAGGLARKKLSKSNEGPQVILETTNDVLKHETTTLDYSLFNVPEKYKLDD